MTRTTAISIEQKRDAFKAYRDGIMSDEQLAIAKNATDDLIDTMHAMDVCGIAMLGFILQQQSLESYVSARLRNAADIARAKRAGAQP